MCLLLTCRRWSYAIRWIQEGMTCECVLTHSFICDVCFDRVLVSQRQSSMLLIGCVVLDTLVPVICVHLHMLSSHANPSSIDWPPPPTSSLGRLVVLLRDLRRSLFPTINSLLSCTFPKFHIDISLCAFILVRHRNSLRPPCPI